MSPRTIVQRAVAAGLDAIAVVDHNCARNAPAVVEAAGSVGLAVLVGLEVTSFEDVHVLSLFEDAEGALAMDAEVSAALMPIPNRPERFGDQPVVSAEEEILEFVPHYLGQSTSLGISEIVGLTRQHGGICIAAHVDRDVFSMTSQLGFVSGREGFDAVEVTRFTSEAEAEVYRKVYPVVIGSDAHYPDDIGASRTIVDIETLCIEALRDAFARRTVKRQVGGRL
jgi:hypothetical protein